MEPREHESSAPIVSAFSPTTAAREPVEFGIAASAFTGAPLVVVAVQQTGPMVHRFVGDVDDAPDAARSIEHLRTDFQRRKLDAEVAVVEERTVSGGLERVIEERKPQLVVLGSTHRGAVGSVLLGTTAERVIHQAACPVAIVPNGYRRPEGGVQVVGAAFAPTPEGREALNAAAALARTAGARLRAITVTDPDHAEQSSGLLAEQHHTADPQEAAHARERLDAASGLREAVAEVAGDLDAEVDVLVQDTADALVAASRQLDLLVMGSRAQAPKRAVVLGSVSRKVVDRAACPVLVLPRGASEATEALLAGAKAHGAR